MKLDDRIRVGLKSDTRGLRRELARAQLAFEHRWWKRLLLRFRIWRISREQAP